MSYWKQAKQSGLVMCWLAAATGLTGFGRAVPTPSPAATPKPPTSPNSTPSPTLPPQVGACSGKVGAPGNSTRSVTVGSLNRTFRVHVPRTLNPNSATPIVLLFHGLGMSGSLMQTMTGMDSVADAEGFVTVYPDGNGSQAWNAGSRFFGSQEDDLGFLDKIVDNVAQDQCLNRERVYVTGFSMGGYFSHHAGCALGGKKLAAVSPVSGGDMMGGSTCPGGPVPIFMIHGDADAVVSYATGTSARNLWIKRNGCQNSFETKTISGGGSCDTYNGCAAPVVFCTFAGKGHTWPSGGARLVWDFLKQYQRK